MNFRKSLLGVLASAFSISSFSAQNPASVTYVDQKIAASEAKITSSQPPTYQLGDCVEGGIVFYVDATKRHGLVAALRGQSYWRGQQMRVGLVFR